MTLIPYIKYFIAIAVVVILLLAYFISSFLSKRNIAMEEFTYYPKTHRVTITAYGDVNIGRTVGQRILEGDIDFPFKKINLSEDSADIIFANLECQLSDQKGETQHPKNNLIFTGPPQGASTLKNSGVTLFSTANNHAFDYGKHALEETIRNLQKEQILFTGTSLLKENLYKPLIIKKNNIKFAIFAVTDVMNFKLGWQGMIAFADSAKLFPEIRYVKDLVDVVIVSFHGGVEYSEQPAKRVKQFAEACVTQGARLFLGHHPHVTFGIEKIASSFVVHSLGNFVFYQPQYYWTQRGYGAKFVIEKVESNVNIQFAKILPLDVSYQPQPLRDTIEISKLVLRTQKLSNIKITYE